MPQSIGPIQVNPPAQVLWQSNAVASGNLPHYYTGEHEGTLSIKSMLAGQGVWRTPDGTHRIDPTNYVVLNKGQKYTLEIQSSQPVRTLAIFFRSGFVESLRAALKTNGRDLDPKEAPNFEFAERLEPKCDRMQSATLQFYRAFRQPHSESWEIEDRFYEIAKVLLDIHDSTHIERERLIFQRSATANEIYRRLNLARDLILSTYAQPIGLDDMATAAYLSPSHFHHLFKVAYGMTPHQFLTNERIRRATALLRATDLPLWQILPRCRL